MLSQRKVEQVLASQSSIARKIYEIMTVDQKWSVHQVLIEFKNAHGNMPERKVMSGCLNDLTDSGLLKRTGADLYSKMPTRKPSVSKDMVAKVADPIAVSSRAPVVVAPKPSTPKPATPAIPQPTISKEVPMVSKPAATAKQVNKDPLDVLATLVHEALEASNKLVTMAEALETAALELKVEREKNKAYSEKIQRLDALLAEFKS